MNRSEKAKNWIMRLAAVLLCLVLVTTWATGRMYARYTTRVTVSDRARVALWGNNQSIALNSIKLPQQPGESCTYTITVSNQRSDGLVSEVNQKYYIEVVTAGNLPLTYTMQKDSIPLGTFTETAQNSVWTISGDSMVFQAGVAENSEYTMTVTWPSNQVDQKLANVPDYIQVNVCSEQVD